MIGLHLQLALRYQYQSGCRQCCCREQHPQAKEMFASGVYRHSSSITTIKHTLSLSWYSERRLLNNGGTPLCSACVISVSKRLRNSSPSHSNKSTAHKTIHYRHSLMASAISIPSKVCMLTDNKNTRTALQGGVHCFTWFTCSSLSCSNATQLGLGNIFHTPTAQTANLVPITDSDAVLRNQLQTVGDIWSTANNIWASTCFLLRNFESASTLLYINSSKK